MTPPISPARETQPTPPVVRGVRDIVDRHDAFILDLWGCVHNGVRPFPGVIEALRRLKAADKRVLMLSNAPRRASVIVGQLERNFGIGADLYDAVLTSGEVTWQALKRRDDPQHARLGTRCLHIGPERDLGMFEGNGLVRVTDAETAEFVLATGPNDDGLDVPEHEPILRAARARNLPLVCANPDLEVIRGETRLVCSGAIAARYEELGGAGHLSRQAARRDLPRGARPAGHGPMPAASSASATGCAPTSSAPTAPVCPAPSSPAASTIPSSASPWARRRRQRRWPRC